MKRASHLIALFLYLSFLATRPMANAKISPQEPTSEKVTKEKKQTPSKEKAKSTADKIMNTTVDFAEKAYDYSKKAVSKTNTKLGNSRTNRGSKNHSILGNYSLIDTWIPSKFGVQYTYIQNPSTSWEVSWDQGSIGYGVFFVDIAKIKDQRFSIVRTSYSQRNSFYLTYGLNYYKFSATLGSKLLSSVTSSLPSIDLVEISSLGASFGIGNRWQFKNWVFGVNWVSIHIPIVTLNKENLFLDNTSSQSDRETIENTMDVVERIPTFTALRVQFGYSF